MSSNNPAQEEDNHSEQRFQLAANAARRIARQCHAHADRVCSKLSGWINAVPASPSTVCGVDKMRALAGDHRSSFGQRIMHLEAQCNAVLSHLEGARTLLNSDPILMLPAVPIVRAIAEVSASCAWGLDSNATPDERAARSYATAFRSLETVVTLLGAGTPDARPLVELRGRLVAQMEEQGYGVVRRNKNGVSTDEIAQVRVGDAYVKTNFQFSQRVREEIPSVGFFYAGMSGITHGEPTYLASTWETPDVLARMLGVVVLRSTEAWSSAVHTWIGATPPQFVNSGDYANLMRSIPPERLTEFVSSADDAAAEFE